MVDFLHFLKNTSYPGRGILVGKDRVYYFIMGRRYRLVSSVIFRRPS